MNVQEAQLALKFLLESEFKDFFSFKDLETPSGVREVMEKISYNRLLVLVDKFTEEFLTRIEDDKEPMKVSLKDLLDFLDTYSGSYVAPDIYNHFSNLREKIDTFAFVRIKKEVDTILKDLCLQKRLDETRFVWIVLDYMDSLKNLPCFNLLHIEEVKSKFTEYAVFELQ